LPLFEKKYPTNKSVRDCIQATKDFIAGKIKRDQLLEKRAAAAYAAADAAAAAADAAAAAYAAAYEADAAYAAAAAAYAAAAAAYEDARRQIWKIIINKLFELLGEK
jgi:hypothetical protein